MPKKYIKFLCNYMVFSYKLDLHSRELNFIPTSEMRQMCEFKSYCSGWNYNQNQLSYSSTFSPKLGANLN